jgi:hypothetical protein
MIYYCCDWMRRLDRMGYVRKQEIYFQSHSIPNKFPMDLRGYRFCMACGVGLKNHPSSSNGNIQCTMLAEGLLDEKIVPVIMGPIGGDENEYAYNLNTRDVWRRSKPNINYPQSARVDYCPYCGYAHISDYANGSNENLFVLAEYWI